MEQHQMALLIPILAVSLGLAIPIVAVLAEYRRKRALIEALNKERLAAIEKGVAPPAWPQNLTGDSNETDGSPEALERARHRQLTRGLTLLFVGVAILFGLPQLIGADTARAGLLLIAWGAAVLIAWAVRGKRAAAKDDSAR